MGIRKYYWSKAFKPKFLLLIFGVYFLTNSQRGSTKKVVFTGLVEDVFIGGVNDVVIRLNRDPKRYFMNRGLEEGLTISQIKKDLINQVVVIETKPEGFNLFDIYDNLKEIDVITVNDKVLYKVQ